MGVRKAISSNILAGKVEEKKSCLLMACKAEMSPLGIGGWLGLGLGARSKVTHWKCPFQNTNGIALSKMKFLPGAEKISKFFQGSKEPVSHQPQPSSLSTPPPPCPPQSNKSLFMKLMFESFQLQYEIQILFEFLNILSSLPASFLKPQDLFLFHFECSKQQERCPDSL